MTQVLVLAWSEVLDLEPSDIQEDDNFFDVGGDSVTAMRLVGAAQKQGLDINAETIFNYPRLSDMETHCPRFDKELTLANTSTPSADKNLLQFCASACGVEPTVVADVFQSPPLQAQILNLHCVAEKPGYLMKQLIFRVEPARELPTVIAAFEAVRMKNQILRTRIVRHDEGPFQVVLSDEPQWEASSSLADLLARDWNTRMEFGAPLNRFAVVRELEQSFVVWTAHHCVEDEWTRNLLLDGIEQYLISPQKYKEAEIAPSFKDFVSYYNAKAEEGTAFWQKFNGELAFRNPLWTLPKYHSFSHQEFNKTFNLHTANRKQEDIAVSTIAHGAFGLALAAICGDPGLVVLNSVRMGRQIPLRGVERIMGPLMTVVPICLRPSSHDTTGDYLRKIQRDFVSMMPYEHLAGPALKVGLSDFPALNWHMNSEEMGNRVIKFKQGEEEALIRPNPVSIPPESLNRALYVSARIVDDTLEISMVYDPSLLKAFVAEAVVDYFLHFLKAMLQKPSSQKMHDLLGTKDRVAV